MVNILFATWGAAHQRLCPARNASLIWQDDTTQPILAGRAIGIAIELDIGVEVDSTGVKTAMEVTSRKAKGIAIRIHSEVANNFGTWK